MGWQNLHGHSQGVLSLSPSSPGGPSLPGISQLYGAWLPPSGHRAEVLLRWVDNRKVLQKRSDTALRL